MNYKVKKRIMVPYHFESRIAFPSLLDFSEANVGNDLSRGDTRHLDADLRNCLERVFIMRDISRSESIRFIFSHSGPT